MGQHTPFSYEIRYTKAAEKCLSKHEDVRSAYESAIRELLTGDHPERIDVTRIQKKHNDYYRIRLGEYRVVYAVIKGVIVVITTLLAGPRSDVYKKTGGLK